MAEHKDDERESIAGLFDLPNVDQTAVTNFRLAHLVSKQHPDWDSLDVVQYLVALDQLTEEYTRKKEEINSRSKSITANQVLDRPALTTEDDHFQATKNNTAIHSRPSRAGKRQIMIHVNQEVYDKFKEVGRSQNLSTDFLGHKALELLFREIGIPVPEAVQERLVDPTPKKPGPAKGTPRPPRAGAS